MPNPRYRSGVTYERKIKKELENDDYLVIRASGSHGNYDLVGFNRKKFEVIAIQCKRCQTEGQANRLEKEFRANPGLDKQLYPNQAIYIYIADKKETRRAWA